MRIFFKVPFFHKGFSTKEVKFWHAVGVIIVYKLHFCFDTLSATDAKHTTPSFGIPGFSWQWPVTCMMPSSAPKNVELYSTGPHEMKLNLMNQNKDIFCWENASENITEFGTRMSNNIPQKTTGHDYLSMPWPLTNYVSNTETKMSSFWWNLHHWLHWKLSKWQLSVQPVMKISSKWQHFRFSERGLWDDVDDGLAHSSLVMPICIR